MSNHMMVIAEEVLDALNEKRAVVALESTLISHGMPYPDNQETALEIEALVRKAGAVPATCAILEGKMKVGLTSSEIEFFAQAKNIVKASPRTFPQIMARREHGATTVAATVFMAQLASIPVMATGGIGGVHRGAESSFDISADLTQMASSPVAVVCAGAKSILDLPKTLEYLETLMVPVVGYGQKEFPAFYTRKSGLELETFFETPSDLASYLNIHWELHPSRGVVVTNPVPLEHAFDDVLIEEAILQALQEAQSLGVSGKKVTPFLLDRLCHITQGRSLMTNKALILNNGYVGGLLAHELAQLRSQKVA